jgi:hypothetical protein
MNIAPVADFAASIARRNGTAFTDAAASIATVSTAPVADFAASIAKMNSTVFTDVAVSIARMNTAPLVGFAATLGQIDAAHLADFSATIGTFNNKALADLYGAVAAMNTAPLADVAAALEQGLQRVDSSDGALAEEIRDRELATPATAEALAAAVILLAVYVIVQSHTDVVVIDVAEGIAEYLVGLALLIIRISAELQDHFEPVRGVLGIAGAVGLAVGVERVGRRMLRGPSDSGEGSRTDDGRPLGR